MLDEKSLTRAAMSKKRVRLAVQDSGSSVEQAVADARAAIRLMQQLTEALLRVAGKLSLAADELADDKPASNSGRSQQDAKVTTSAPRARSRGPRA